MNTYSYMKFAALICIIIFAVLYISFKKTIYTYHNHDLVLIHPFFPKHHFNEIATYCKKLDSKLQPDERLPSRTTYVCDSKRDYALYHMVYSTYLFKQLKQIIGENMIIASEFPIEYRKYALGSSGMEWHQDKALYDQPYYECVLTIGNTSDSLFEYNVDDEINSVSTHPNSLVLVKPSTIYHRVTKVTQGERTIIKFVCLLNEKNEKSPEYASELPSETK